MQHRYAIRIEVKTNLQWTEGIPGTVETRFFYAKSASDAVFECGALFESDPCLARIHSVRRVKSIGKL